MPLLNWIFPSSVSVQQASSWGIEVARRCQTGVAARLGPAFVRMSLPEARGYIQARAATVLQAEMTDLVERTGCDQAMARAVQQRAMDEVMRIAMGDLLKAARPAVHRMAA